MSMSEHGMALGERRTQAMELGMESEVTITRDDGSSGVLNIDRIQEAFAWASRGYEGTVNYSWLMKEIFKNVFNGMSTREIEDALILAAIPFIEHDPAYSRVTARLLSKQLFREVTDQSIIRSNVDAVYRQSFIQAIVTGVTHGLLDQRMHLFDLDILADALVLERDDYLDYMGLKTLNERYFLKYNGKRVELLQTFWMRVAMGLAMDEVHPTEAAQEFYHLMSRLLYVPSTPTLLHSGLVRAQLSSCFLSTVNDDLRHIFKCLSDNAQISKWSGGLGTDWTNVRATGALVKSIKTESQGVIPFLKISNDTTAAINRSGSRRAAAVVYLETWHLDIEDFLDLRRNTGDERRRTHDINTANWIPDLFIKRVLEDEQWTLFSPHEVPDLHHIYGREFELRYIAYEEEAQRGNIEKYKVVSALKLWRKMLSRLFETGHPWLTFKDACNVRSPQDHVGVVHSSNLCTEVVLNTSEDETAVCNLGSINLARHVTNGVLDKERLISSIKLSVRMLDNVIDTTFYPTTEARTANKRHRPIGLGIMGLQDILYMLDIPFADPAALHFNDTLMEFISYHAILASSELAKERGTYESYRGSKWDRGIFPYDTLALLEHERGMTVDVDRSSSLDWGPVREHVRKHGMRNSNTMAIAPTATISNISGCFPSIEPIYKNLYVKANMSGEFTIVNKYLVNDLKRIGKWNEAMLDTLKYYDGNVNMIDEIPQELKVKYQEAFAIDPQWLVKITAVRAKWIDQSQSHNVFMASLPGKNISGKELNDVYIDAWRSGIKTMYYFRTLGATQIEKSTLDAKKFGFTQKRSYAPSTTETYTHTETKKNVDELNIMAAKRTCTILEDPTCESCQ